MVDDDDVALRRSPVHFGDEASLKCAALLAQAGLGARIQLVPQRAGLRQRRQFRAVTGLRRLLPGSDGAIVLDLLQSRQHRLVGQVIELLLAEIVVAALHVADIQLAIAVREERLLEERDVFVEELFLQILGAGRNDDALARADDRQQVGQRLCRCRCRLQRSGAASPSAPALRPAPSATARGEIRTPDGSSKALLRARRSCAAKHCSCGKTRAGRTKAIDTHADRYGCCASAGTERLPARHAAIIGLQEETQFDACEIKVVRSKPGQGSDGNSCRRESAASASRDRRSPQRRQVHALQSAGRFASRHCRRRARHHPRPALRRDGVARPSLSRCRYRRHHSGRQGLHPVGNLSPGPGRTRRSRRDCDGGRRPHRDCRARSRNLRACSARPASRCSSRSTRSTATSRSRWKANSIALASTNCSRSQPNTAAASTTCSMLS